MVPYFVLCACNLVAVIPIEYLAGTKGESLVFSTVKHIYYIFYSFGEADKMPMCTPLWFLPCLFLASIYMYFYLKLSNEWKIIIGVIFVALNWSLQQIGITQLPWHFDVAMIAMLIMYFGYMIRRQSVITRGGIVTIILGLLVGIVAIYLNSKVDMVYREYGNLFLFGVGLVAINIALIVFFGKYACREKFLA